MSLSRLWMPTVALILHQSFCTGTERQHISSADDPHTQLPPHVQRLRRQHMHHDGTTLIAPTGVGHRHHHNKGPTIDRPPPGWSISRNDTAFAVPYFQAANGGSDGSMVTARLAGAAGGVSDTRALPISVTRRADSHYAADVAKLVSSWYASVEGPLLNLYGPMVLASSHRTALYVGEALHAPVYPAQTLAFADTVVQACATTLSGASTVLVGADYDYDGLWLWIKPARVDGIPPVHGVALQNASELVILRTSDPGEYVGALDCGGGGWLSVHSSLPELAARGHPELAALWAEIEPLLVMNSSHADGATLRQWEWGLPDVTVAAYTAAWIATGKPASAITILEGGVVDGYLAVPKLWRAYFAHNGASARGVQLESYWVAQPTLARQDGVVPIPSYAFYKPDFLPLYSAAVAELAAIVNRTSAAATANHTRAFINKVGSATDVEGVERLYAAAGVEHGAWASVGLDCPPAVCTDVFGDQVPCPHLHASTVLANNHTLLPSRTWKPLTVAQVREALAPQWGPSLQ